MENQQAAADLAGGKLSARPDGTVRFLRSALQVFAAEARLHLQGRCSAASGRPFLPIPAGPATDADWSSP